MDIHEYSEQEILNKAFNEDTDKLKVDSSVDTSEHGTVGGVSTGQPFKVTAVVDPDSGEYNPLNGVLRKVLSAIINPPYLDKSINAIRNQVQSGTITTVTTVSTVTNLTNFGSQAADVTFRINSNNAWANNVRRLIT